MFWRLGFRHQSPIDVLLDRKGITLEEVLSQEELTSEMRIGNEKLVSYLCQESVLSELITYATRMPPEGADETRASRIPNVACEVLCSDYSERLCKSMLSSPTHIKSVIDCLKYPAPLHPIIGYYFFRMVQAMLHLDVVRFLSEFKTLDANEYVPLLLSHVTTSYIPEVILALQGGGPVYEAARAQNPTLYRDVAELYVADWWLDGGFVPLCLDKVCNTSAPEEERCVLVQVLVEPLRRWGYAHVTGLAEALLQTKNVGTVLGLLKEENLSQRLCTDVLEYAAIAVEMCCTREAMTSIPDDDGEAAQPKLASYDMAWEGTALESVCAYIPTLVSWLAPSNNPDANLSELNLPGMHIPVRAGNRRVRVLELLLCMVRARKQCLDDALLACNVFRVCLDALLAFHNNNLVHCLVTEMFVEAMKQTECEKLKNEILALHEATLDAATQKPRQQNFAHLILLSNEMLNCLPESVVEESPHSDFIKNVLKGEIARQSTPLITDEGRNSSPNVKSPLDKIVLGPPPERKKPDPKMGIDRYRVTDDNMNGGDGAQDDDDDDFASDPNGAGFGGRFDISEMLDDVVCGTNMVGDDEDAVVWEERVLVDMDDVPEPTEMLSPTLPLPHPHHHHRSSVDEHAMPPPTPPAGCSSGVDDGSFEDEVVYDNFTSVVGLQTPDMDSCQEENKVKTEQGTTDASPVVETSPTKFNSFEYWKI
eukprot:PhM_4_TR1723/c0_g1_i1/m.30600/K15501/PPP6R3, SAPS3; serine/threonine-protein phosphatase 6 regulatory subunit 3